MNKLAVPFHPGESLHVHELLIQSKMFSHDSSRNCSTENAIAIIVCDKSASRTDFCVILTIPVILFVDGWLKLTSPIL